MSINGAVEARRPTPSATINKKLEARDYRAAAHTSAFAAALEQMEKEEKQRNLIMKVYFVLH